MVRGPHAHAGQRSIPRTAPTRACTLTSDFTLLGPLRFHLYRQVRLRAAALGRTIDVDERRIAEGVPHVTETTKDTKNTKFLLLV